MSDGGTEDDTPPESPSHPASGEGRQDIPDLVEEVAQAAEDDLVEPNEHAELDYQDEDIPRLAEEVAEIAENYHED